MNEFLEREYPEYRLIRETKIGEIFYALDILTSHRHIKTMMTFEISGKIEVFSMKIELQ